MSRAKELEIKALQMLGYQQATAYKSHYDGITASGELVQVKSFIKSNKTSISNTYFKQLGLSDNISIADMYKVIEHYLNDINKLVLVYSSNGVDIDNIVEYNHTEGVQWVKQHAKRSYTYIQGKKVPQIKIGRTIPKEQ